MIKLDEIRKDLGKVRTAICQSIAEFMENHNCTELDVTDFDSTPIIIEDCEDCDNTYTMDRLTMTEMEMSKYIARTARIVKPFTL